MTAPAGYCDIAEAATVLGMTEARVRVLHARGLLVDWKQWMDLPENRVSRKLRSE